MNDKVINPVEVGRSTVLIYGSMSLPLAMVSYPLGIWVPRLYASDVGLSLALVGLVITAAALSDAITDPVMGFVSDRWRTRWGRRKPWIFVGLPLFGVAVWMLLNPPSDATVIYLAVWFIALRMGSTLFGLPYAAWGVELSAEYHTRTRIQSVREKYVLIGLIGGSSIPLLVEWSSAINVDPAFINEKFGWVNVLGAQLFEYTETFLVACAEGLGFTDSSPSTVLSSYSFGILFLLPLTGFLVLTFVPEVPASPVKNKVGLFKSLKLMARNGLFRRILIIEVLIAGGENFRNALSLFFMQDYIGVRFAGEMYVVYFSVGLLAISFWDALAKRWGKHQSLACAMVLVGFVSLWIFTLDYGDVGAFYILFAMKGFCFGAFAYLPRAMLADVVDIDTSRSGDARPASYFAILGIMTKIAASFGGLSLPILALVGYQAIRTPEVTNGPTELMWLGILYAIVPTALFVVAFVLCWTWPLTGERHARIQKLLQSRNARLQRKHAESEKVTPGE